jgi:hypothetical protein
MITAANGVIKHFDLDGWQFGSYSEVLKRKLVVPETQDRSKINSSLLFVGNFTEDNLQRADGFVAQLISCMYKNAFLYNFGRVKTLIWMRSPSWHSLVAPRRHWARKKVSVMREVSCDARIVARVAKPSKVKMHGWDSLELENVNEIIDLTEKDFSPMVFAIWIVSEVQIDAALIELTPFEQNKVNSTTCLKKVTDI